MAKILLIDGETVKALDEADFGEESKLQDYLEKYPSLVPPEDVMEEAPELICIGKEVTVPPSCAMELLFTDKNGLLTIVETKLVSNPQIRREVVGQVIEYASYVSQWTAEKVYEIANAHVREDFDSFMLNKYPDFSPEEFRVNIEQNLRDGKIRLIVAVDKLIEPLRQLVTFLNSHSDLKILLLEVSSFGKTKEKVLAPKIFGYKPQPPITRRKWGETRFFTDLEESIEPKEKLEVIRKLYEFTKNNADEITWGTGVEYGSFTFRKLAHGTKISIFTVYSSGLVNLNFGAMKGKGVKGGI